MPSGFEAAMFAWREHALAAQGLLPKKRDILASGGEPWGSSQGSETSVTLVEQADARRRCVRCGWTDSRK